MTGSRVGFDGSNIDIINGGPINGSFGNAMPGMLAASAARNGSMDEAKVGPIEGAGANRRP